MTSEQRRARFSAMMKAMHADPQAVADREARISAGQKRRFATDAGKAHQKAMQAARWGNRPRQPPMTREQARLAGKLQRCGIPKPHITARQMLPAQPEQRT